MPHPPLSHPPMPHSPMSQPGTAARVTPRELPVELRAQLFAAQRTLSAADQNRTEVLERRLWVPRPLSEVFGFFAEAGNLQKLTPAFLDFRIVTPQPITMAVGTLIDYRISLHGVPMRWRTRISAWQPPHRFADEQLRGPYSIWWHEHHFVEHDGGTSILDRVHYRAPLSLIAHPLIVRRELAQIFDYRTQIITSRFAAAPSF